MAPSSQFALRKLHSLSGLIPLGLFLLEHLFTNSLALYGPERYNAQVKLLKGLPFLLGLELVLIFLPLLYHGLYGLYIAYTGQVSLGRYNYARNWTYVLQRITGVIMFAFLILHVWTMRVQPALQGTEVSFQLVAQRLSNPLTAALYLVATISTIFHFTNGLWNMAVDWGVTIGPRAQSAAWKASWVLFGLLSAASASFVVAFIRGGGI